MSSQEYFTECRTNSPKEQILQTKDGNPWVGVRTSARHADGRYTDMIWKGVSREARLALLNIKTDNKTISQIYFTVKYI